MAMLQLGGLFGALAAGVLSDHLGRFRILVAALACITISGLLSAAVGDFALLVLLRWALGLGFGATVVTVPVLLVAEVQPRQYRGKMLASFGIGWPLGALYTGALASSTHA